MNAYELLMMCPDDQVGRMRATYIACLDGRFKDAVIHLKSASSEHQKTNFGFACECLILAKKLEAIK